MKNTSFSEFIRVNLLPLDADACLWLAAALNYFHTIDDIIDKEIPQNKHEARFLIETFEFAEVVFSNHFYIANVNRLRPLVKMAANAYMDSILWEGDKEVWKRQLSDHLRQIGNEIIMAVFEIVGGTKLRNELSPTIREICYKSQH